MKKEEASMKKLATCKWFEAKSPEGYSYYWNTETNGINLTVFLPQAQVILPDFGYHVQDLWFSCCQTLLTCLAFQSFDFKLT